MRRVAPSCLLALLFAAPAIGAAQSAEPEPAADESAEEPETVEYPAVRIGIGASLSSRPLVLVGDDGTAGSPAGMAGVHVPFYLGEHLRLEPEFGILVQNGGSILGLGPLFVPAEGERFDLHVTVFRFLLGIQWATRLGRDTVAYVGPKVGMQSRTITLDFGAETNVGDVKVRAVDFWLGAVAGGEAFLTSHFSLGAEIGFYYLNQGSPAILVVSQERDTENLANQWFLSTQALLAARVYFL